MTEHDDLLVSFGGSIKMMDDGKIGGYAVLFSGPKDPDLYGDFFTSETDFGDVKTVGLYYQHGYDPVLKNTRIGSGSIRYDERGLWFEAQIEDRHDYVDMIRDLVEKGKLGYSSGAVGHLVSRKEAPNGTGEITAWPLGEVSLVTRPAEPRISVMPVKAFAEMASGGAEPEALEAEAGLDHPAPNAVEAKSDADTGAAIAEPNPQTEDGADAPEQHTMSEKTEPQGEVKAFDAEAAMQKLTERLESMQKSFDETRTVTGVAEIKGAPAYVKETGDSQKQAFARWVKTGDRGAVRDMLGVNDHGQEVVEIKASNATDMNIGTAADGGNTVTDDMYNQIVARADEQSLAARAGVTRFTSRGTTLDIPVDNEADSEFVAANEAAQFDEDAPAIGQVVATKVKYTKRTLVSYELMQDTAVNLMDHIMTRVAMGKAKTDNSLLVAAIEADGTQFDIFAGTSAIAVDELENVAINDTNAWYVENPRDAKWIMRPSTHKAISVLDDTSIRRYYDNQQGGPRELLGSEILYSNKVDAIGSGNKPVLFGNFSYVAQVEDPSLQFLRDPYTRADYGQVRLLWYYRTVFKVLQAAAVGYGRNIAT